MTGRRTGSPLACSSHARRPDHLDAPSPRRPDRARRARRLHGDEPRGRHDHDRTDDDVDHDDRRSHRRRHGDHDHVDSTTSTSTTTSTTIDVDHHDVDHTSTSTTIVTSTTDGAAPVIGGTADPPASDPPVPTSAPVAADRRTAGGGRLAAGVERRVRIADPRQPGRVVHRAARRPGDLPARRWDHRRRHAGHHVHAAGAGQREQADHLADHRPAGRAAPRRHRCADAVGGDGHRPRSRLGRRDRQGAAHPHQRHARRRRLVVRRSRLVRDPAAGGDVRVRREPPVAPGATRTGTTARSGCSSSTSPASNATPWRAAWPSTRSSTTTPT